LLEHIPIDEGQADCVTSNCVVNLSPDKRAVFAEIWRILRDHGRLVLADIVSEEAVPPHLRVNPQLWGECLSGALTEDELLAELERAGFYGIQILKRAFWRKVEGYSFSSVTVRAFKFETKNTFLGHRALYSGPYKSVTDEEGLLFRRNEPVEVSVGTAEKLRHPPYNENFDVLEPSGTVAPKAKLKSLIVSGRSSSGTGCCCS
jgi:SAM-dependent methyltransferase